ncbi:MAG: hypothetical protein V1835_02690 [Candidatus Micrarchaeota archaeon]
MAEAKQKKSAGSRSYEIGILAVLAILIFVASFYFFSSQLREHDVNGLRVLSRGDPYKEMSALFTGKKVIIEAYTFPGKDDRNSYVSLLTAEIAGAFGAMNKSAAVYAYAPEEKNLTERLVGCTNQTDFCSNEKIVVQLDDCNCVKVEGGKVYVLYSIDKIKEQALRTKLRGMFGGILKSQK